MQNENYNVVKRQREIADGVSTLRFNDQYVSGIVLNCKKKQSIHDDSLLQKGPKEGYLSISFERDTLCCICLSDYEENDMLGQLW